MKDTKYLKTYKTKFSDKKTVLSNFQKIFTKQSF